MSTETDKQVQNGVNVDALLGARDALSKAPEAAKFNWKASCKWMNGTHSQTSIQGFYGLGQQQSHKTEFTFDTDHPEIFASEDKGAEPCLLEVPLRLLVRRRDHDVIVTAVAGVELAGEERTCRRVAIHRDDPWASRYLPFVVHCMLRVTTHGLGIGTSRRVAVSCVR